MTASLSLVAATALDVAVLAGAYASAILAMVAVTVQPWGGRLFGAVALGARFCLTAGGVAAVLRWMVAP